MEEGRGEEGSETGAAWDGRSGDKLSDTVEFATESGFECPCGGGGELFLDGERREEKRDREEGREGGRRRTTEGSVRSSPVDVRGSIYKQKEEEDGGVRSGSGEEEESGDSLGCDCPLARSRARWREMLEGSENACASAENDCDPDDRGGQERK